MKTNAEIKDMLFTLISQSELATAVNGIVSKVGRVTDSKSEDIIISILDSGSGQLQEFIANVNIYIADIKRKGNVFENSQRIAVLSKKSVELFESCIGEYYRLQLDKQQVFEVQGKAEHCINNRLKITVLN